MPVKCSPHLNLTAATCDGMIPFGFGINLPNWDLNVALLEVCFLFFWQLTHLRAKDTVGVSGSQKELTMKKPQNFRKEDH